MQRRLTVAMTVMVLVTLVLSGLATLVIAQRSTVTQTGRDLMREAQGLAAAVQQEGSAGAEPAARMRSLLIMLRTPLRLDGSSVLAISPNGRFFDPTQPRPLSTTPILPAGLTAGDLDPQALNKLQTESGRKGSLVFVAVPYVAQIRILGAARNVTQVVVLTRVPPSALRLAGPWFFLSSLVILAVAGVVANRLGRRFVRPVLAVQAVTTRIAAGDLAARVPEPPRADPELDGLVTSVNSMAARLGDTQDAERRFLQSVSHDLRTPLTSIRGFAEAIEDGATADAVAAAGVIATEARRLERLVGDLLALATLEARRFTLQLQPVDLYESAAYTAAGFVPAAADLGLALSATPPGHRSWAHADPDRLAQVTANLVENALRYATHQVGVAVVWVAGGPELHVTDDGPGISPDDLPRVFDRLFVARSRPDRPIGSGLGLTIVAELVRAMGGTVWAESPLGPTGGTRMVVRLAPAAPFTNPSAGNEPPSNGAGADPSTRSDTVA